VQICTTSTFAARDAIDRFFYLQIVFKTYGNPDFNTKLMSPSPKQSSKAGGAAQQAAAPSSGGADGASTIKPIKVESVDGSAGAAADANSVSGSGRGNSIGVVAVDEKKGSACCTIF